MKRPILFAAALLVAMPAFANDEMLGTFFGGRMESRNERSIRVNAPDMDREEMQRDRQERQQRAVRQIERKEDEAARNAAQHGNTAAQ